MKIIFEKARIEDAERLLEIQRKAFRESLETYKDYETNPSFEKIEKITKKIENHFYYKIVADNEIIGGIHAYEKVKGEMYLNRIYILPKYENLGIGKTAMDFTENHEQFKNIVKWTLETPHKSYKNQYFYEKNGYKKTGKEGIVADNLILIHYEKVKAAE